MTFIKINNTLYPATIEGKMTDSDWDNRESKSITLEMTYTRAVALFVNGLVWSIIQAEDVPSFDEEGNEIGVETVETEYDNSEYSVPGDITDHRNGTITAKMGKITDSEALAELMEVLA